MDACQSHVTGTGTWPHSSPHTGSGEGAMPTRRASSQALFASLPGSALLHIFKLLCDSCPPEAPGTRWLAPVCSQWRDLACHVEGLRVLLWSEQQQHVTSVCAWLRRHARQVVALAIHSRRGTEFVEVLVEVATAAAADMPFPLQRLVVTNGLLVDSEVCRDTLQPLVGALPHLQHLHLHLLLACRDAFDLSTHPDEAAGHPLTALQHAAALTSLVLDGPLSENGMEEADVAHAQLLAVLPCSLRRLTWRLSELQDPRQLAFGHLTALTHLQLSSYPGGFHHALPDDAFTSLRQLQQLDLRHVRVSEELLLAHEQQLLRLAPVGNIQQVLAQLTHLQSLKLQPRAECVELLQQAPNLQELSVQLQYGGRPLVPSSPWVLHHYSGLTGLQRLSLTVLAGPPPELCALTQLKQLQIKGEGVFPMEHRITWGRVVAQLVNLEVLRVPGVLPACSFPWLTALTRLVVLDVGYITGQSDRALAASHLSQLLASGSASSCSRSAGALLHTQQVHLVCFRDYWLHSKLHQAVVAAVPVLPPNCHLFRGSWQQLQECGVELWPASVAARLKQLL